MCLVSGCPVYTLRRFFWNSFQETEITTVSQMRWNTISSNPSAIVRVVTAMLEMKTLPTGFPVALWSTAIQFCDRHSNRIFLLLRIADFVVDAVDVVDVSVSEVVAFRQVSVLHFKAFFYCNGKFWSLSKRLLRPISIPPKNPIFGVLHPFGFRS